MEFSADAILSRMKDDLKNGDTRIEGSFSMDNLQAVSEELARFNAMRIMPLMESLEEKEDDMGTSGNERHYIRWAKEAKDADGKIIVGNAKVNSPRDGTGLVSVAILTVDAKPPTEEQIRLVQAYIDTKRPVGAEPSVVAAEGVKVSIRADIRILDAASEEIVKQTVEKRLQSYFSQIAFQSGKAVLNYYTITNLILASDGVKELELLQVNGAQESLETEYNRYFILEGAEIHVT